MIISKAIVFSDPFEEQESEYEEKQRKTAEAEEKEKKEVCIDVLYLILNINGEE